MHFRQDRSIRSGMKLRKEAARAALIIGFVTSGVAAQTPDTQALPTLAQEKGGESSEKAEETPSPGGEAEGTLGDDQQATEEASVAVPAVVCGLDKFEGMAQSDARAAAAMICQGLRKYGELVEVHDGGLPPAAEGYRVRAYQLGQRMLLELSYEKPVGTVKTSVRVEFQSVEDLVEESERMVSALKEGKPIENSQRQVEPAAPPAEKEPGVLMYAGIIGFVTVGDITGSAGGADLGLSIPVSKFSFTPHARLAFGEASLGGLGLDLRYYVTRSDNAFFVGAGMGAIGLGVSDAGGSASGGGPAGSMLVGFEFNRRARSRVGLNLRADFPAFPMRVGFDEMGSRESTYVVPLGFNLYLTL